MKLGNLLGTVAVACALGTGAGVCGAQILNATSTGATSAAAANRGAAVSSAPGQGIAESSGSGSARAVAEGASKWTAGGSSFSETGSGAWSGGKGSFGGNGGTAWTAGETGFGQRVQPGGVWRVNESAAPSVGTQLPANSISVPSAVGQDTNASITPGVPGLHAASFASPSQTRKTPARTRAYGYSPVRGLQPRHPASGNAGPGPTLAAHAARRRNSAVAAQTTPMHGLQGIPDSGLGTPSLSDPALSNSGLGDTAPPSSLGLGMPQ